jgi:superfamily I DNA and RNA helicase
MSIARRQTVLDVAFNNIWNVEAPGYDQATAMLRTWWVDLNELDADQRAVIALAPDGDYLVLGPPGCGKTNLLLLRAKYLYKKGLHNIAVIVSTRTLQQFITSGSKGYDFPSDRVLTHTRWQMNFLHEYGVRITPPEGYNEQRTYLTDEITTLVNSRKLDAPFDAILIDEAQDYTVDELILFKRLAKRTFAVADSKQQIYSGKVSQTEIESLFPESKELKYHYRNGFRICQLADAIARQNDSYVSMADRCKYIEKGQESSVNHQRYDNLGAEIEVVLTRVTSQIVAYPDEYIGIITPKREDLELICEKIFDSDLGTLCVAQGAGETIEFTPEKPICICTVHAAKGLEFRATHVLASEKFGRFSNNRNLAFTAVTRTKTALSMYYSGTLPGFLDRALTVLDGKPDDFDLSELFSGVK